MGPVGGIGCLVPRSGPNMALFEPCGAMDGESCALAPVPGETFHGQRESTEYEDKIGLMGWFLRGTAERTGHQESCNPIKL